jgi:hypothetical protein
VPGYLVETYLARGDIGQRTAREQRARSVAAELTRGRTRVRFDRSIHVPEDEMCFFVFEAPSARVAAHAAERAGLGPIRVVAVAPSQDEVTKPRLQAERSRVARSTTSRPGISESANRGVKEEG